MHEFQIKQLHLAAYVMAHGGNFISIKDRIFTLKSEHPLDYWKAKQADSCCRRVDLQLIELRKLLHK